jgi:hypothetical protein
MDLTLWLLLAATIANAALVGASLDQSIKQLPARHRIGVVAFSEFSKAGDLARGVAWYATLGIGTALLTAVAVGVGLAGGSGAPASTALWLALALTTAHSLATSRAAPTNFSQRSAAGDAARLAAIFDRFERRQTARAALQVLTLLAVAWAFVARVGGT